jgi:hypothetical protein
MIEAPEVCDGTDLAGLSCVTLGFDGGNLGCAGNCSSFDTSGCTVMGDDCCAPNGTPGCNDATCEGTVCATNPFCCFVEWDAVCADVATGADGGGNECLVCTCGNGALDGNEACDGADLGGETCITQGFPTGGTLSCLPDCSAFDLSSCGSSGNCCMAHAAPGCEDPACEAAICAGDPFCCSVEWDGICEGSAFANAACNCP